VEAEETPIGYIPTANALDMTGLDLLTDIIEEILSVNVDDWKEEITGHRDFFAMFGDRLPDEMWEESNALACRLNRCSSDS